MIVPLAFADDVVRPAPVAKPQLRFVGIFDVKASATDISTTSAFVNGQVVGALGGTNTTTVADETAVYTEQRAVGFLTYTPRVLDGRASFGVALEVD